MTALLLLLLGCQQPESSAVTDTGPDLLELGRIEGEVRRTVPLVGDGFGHLFVGVFLPGDDDEEPAMMMAWAQSFVDISEDDAAIPFTIQNLYPHTAPYRIAAVFDEAEDLAEDTPECMVCDGDLATIRLYEEPMDEIQIESGQTHPLTLELSVVTTRDWPAGSGQSDTNDQLSGTGVLTGTVSRTATGADDNRGDLWVMLFDGDPLSGVGPVSTTLAGNIDLSDPATVVSYRVEGLPTRDEPWYLVAFLDDNGTGTLPDSGDIIAAEGFGVPQLVVDPETDTVFDIVLNMNPF